MNSVITVIGRNKLLRARAEGLPVPKITGIALGDRGVTEEGVVIEPSEEQNALNHELARKQITGFEYINDLCCRYSAVLDRAELVGAKISEMALYDEDGDLVAIKNMLPKFKDDDIEMGFQLDDSFETEVI